MNSDLLMDELERWVTYETCPASPVKASNSQHQVLERCAAVKREGRYTPNKLLL